MDDFSSINAASGVTTATTSTTKAKEPSDTLGQDQFLKLFVTQLQNQDPMNPQDASEMSSQLAQYSQLEQLTNMNSSMKTLLSAYESSDKLSSLNTIGKEVAYESSSFELNDNPVSIGYRLEHATAKVSITIKKGNSVVATLEGEELGKGDHYLTWDGTNNDGQKLPAGNYTFSIQATDGSREATQLTTLVRSKATGVDLTGGNGGTIRTESGEVAFNSILGVFDQTEAAPASEESETTSDETAASSGN